MTLYVLFISRGLEEEKEEDEKRGDRLKEEGIKKMGCHVRAGEG